MRTRNRGTQQAGLEPEIIDGDLDDEVCIITRVSPPPPNGPARSGGSEGGLSAPGDSVAPPPRDAWREAMKDALANDCSVVAVAPPFGGSVKVTPVGRHGLLPMARPSSLTGPVCLAGGVPGPSAAAEPSAVFADPTGSAPPSEKNTLTVEEVLQSTVGNCCAARTYRWTIRCQ